ncbi:Tetratricopeptide-like helical domain [Trinorchestia longiramus]|nr:Tetratricopeptide-like helical domain [Trinorchestia longiramus]
MLEGVPEWAFALGRKIGGQLKPPGTKWWSAVQKWNAAAALQPADHTLLEMMAQAYMQVGEYVTSIKYAEQAVTAAPLWWCSHQTLGRALMGIGELHRAVLCFSISLRLQPDNSELREHDLKWASQLLSAFKELQKNKAKTASQEPTPMPEKPSLEIIDLKHNPESFEDLEDATKKIPEFEYPTLKKVAANTRLSLTGSSRFISSCSSNKSGETEVSSSREEKSVDLSKMVCMRPKLPER